MKQFTLLVVLLILLINSNVFAAERTKYTMKSDGPLPTSQQDLTLEHADLTLTI